MSAIRGVSSIYAPNLDGGRRLFDDEIAGIVEAHRYDLRALRRRQAQRPSKELEEQILATECRIAAFLETP